MSDFDFKNNKFLKEHFDISKAVESRASLAKKSYRETFGSLPGTFGTPYNSDEITEIFEKCVETHKTFEELTGYTDEGLTDKDFI